MAFTSFEQLAKKTLIKSGVKGRVDTALALDRAQKMLTALLDEDTLSGVRPGFVRFRALTLFCRDASTAACVGPFEQEILEYVNAAFRNPIVDRIQAVLESSYSSSHPGER
ncbi:MAG: hypothetical protein Q8P56_06365 [Candidatus Uhrbacteria bacterium]|nr:hypothetical protein [Candidatus Uhrbacteria bacterium]